MIGPSGCGKSTFIRCLNRMNDLIPGVKVGGQVLYHGDDLYGARRRPGRGPPADRDGVPAPEPVPEVDLRQRRLRAEDARHAGRHGRARRARAPRGRALGRGQGPAEAESPSRCRAASSSASASRARLAVEPEVILLDEPASALDPISTAAIEDLMHELKRDYTLVIVTHNMQQAARVADMTAFFSLDVDGDGRARDPRRVRRDREDLHPPVRQANRGLRHRPLRMRDEFHRGAPASRGEAPVRERSRPALAQARR